MRSWAEPVVGVCSRERQRQALLLGVPEPTDWILQLQADLPADAGGYCFSVPVLKEREYRLDGLFLPPPQRPELPAVILEAQMATYPTFLRRLYAESGRWL